MSVCIVMSDNRPLTLDKHASIYNSLTAYLNKAYATTHNYTFRYYRVKHFSVDDSNPINCVDPHVDELRHASWAKILTTYHALSEGFDYVMYVDSDCGFINFDKEIPSYFEKVDENHNIIFLNNYPHQDYMPCGGAFMCRNTKETRDFLKYWFHYQPQSEWRNVLEKEKINGTWTYGTYWEQDALWCLFRERNDVLVHPSEWMFSEQAGQLVRHFCHFYSTEYRSKMFLEYVTKLEKIHGKYEDIINTIEQISYDTSKHCW